MNNRVVCVVVTYNVNIDFIMALKKYSPQFFKVIVVDNSNEENSINLLKNIEVKNVQVINNLSNIGLDKAQNIGIKKAIKVGAQWIMFLDDDSLLEENMVDKLLEEYNKLDNLSKKMIGILIPRFIDKNTKEHSVHILNTKYFPRRITSGENLKNSDNILTAISSGMLVKVDVIKEIGMMREDLFIDYIDIEFSLRVIKNNYKIYLVNNTYFYHSLGNKSNYNLFGRKIIIYNHSPIRRYYIFRNRLKIYKLYFKDQFKYIVYDFLVLNLELLKIVLFEKNKKENIKFIFKGIKDFLLKNSGEINK